MRRTGKSCERPSLANDLVLVDTSYWIEFFNRPESDKAAGVKSLIEHDRAVLTGVVLAELLQGARTSTELAELRVALAAVEFVETTPDLYARAGTLGFSLRRGGVTAPITDCIIAAAAETIGGGVLTSDRHFESLATVADLTLLPG